MNTTTSNDNFSQAELDKFGALAQRWWDPEGPQKALHALNPARLGYVSDRVKLQGAAVLDVGCGAGLLSEALARNGAQVTALDLAPELIKVAKLHRLESGIDVDYRLQSAEALAGEMPGKFDAITCMEMLEHVPDPAAIVQACATMLKPGGRLFLSTLNRTPAAFALAIVGAEYIARVLPKGTHQYRDFIKPSELAAWLRTAGLQLENVSGLMYEPWRNSARQVIDVGARDHACRIAPGLVHQAADIFELQPGSAQPRGEFGRLDEVTVLVRALGQHARDVLGTHDRQRECGRGAVEGGQEQAATGLQHRRAGLDDRCRIGDVLQHLHAGDRVEFPGHFPGQRFGGLQAIVDVDAAFQAMELGDLDQLGGEVKRRHLRAVACECFAEQARSTTHVEYGGALQLHAIGHVTQACRVERVQRLLRAFRVPPALRQRTELVEFGLAEVVVGCSRVHPRILSVRHPGESRDPF